METWTPSDQGERGVAVVREVLAVAGARPATPAVRALDGELTYAELMDAAEQRADLLRSAGAAEGALVGVCLPPSAELVVTVAAVALVGGVHVALDPAQPSRRTAGMLAAGDVPFLVTGAGSGEALGGDPLTDLPRATAGGASVELRRLGPPLVRYADLAYVVFTSGSTGTPKGVMVEHAGLRNLARWHAQAFGVVAGSRCSQIAAPGFDAFLWELWGCLAAGGTLCVAPREVLATGAGLQEWLLAERVEVGFVPTLLAEDLIDRSWPADAPLRVLLTGGDRLSRRPPADLPFTLVNNYGLSEATVVSTSGAVSASEAGPPSIGRPIEGVRCLIVDAAMQPVAPGTPGELVIGGQSVARGYLGDPGLTEQRFVELVVDGVRQRAYRTGDLVAELESGELAFCGRNDEQVQVTGHRIEPAEIQQVLDRHPRVARSAVLSGPDGRLLAFVLPTATDLDGIDEAQLRRHLLEWLPPTMVPAAFASVASLPVTPNGKLDREALLQLAPERTGREAADELEAAIAEAIAELLGLESVAPDDNFLLLGGHSLLAAQLVTQLSEDYGVELSLHALFTEPTAEGLARQVRELLIEQVRDLDDVTAARMAVQDH